MELDWRWRGGYGDVMVAFLLQRSSPLRAMGSSLGGSWPPIKDGRGAGLMPGDGDGLFQWAGQVRACSHGKGEEACD